MPFSSFSKKKEGRPSLTGAAGERSQVRTLEREAPVAVISLATLSVPSSSRAAARFSRISVVSRVPHLERPGVASAAVEPTEEGGAMIGGC